MSFQAPTLTVVQPAGKTRSRLIRRAKLLSWLSLLWMTIEGAVGVTAGLIAGSVALSGFGLDSVLEGTASVIVIWRFTGGRESSEEAECRAQKLVGASFFLLAPYIAVDAILTLADRSHPRISWVGVALALGSIALMPLLGRAKASLGRGSAPPRPPARARRTCSAPTWPPGCWSACSPTRHSRCGGSIP